MRTLTISLVHDGKTEENSFEFFNETLSPLLEHLECDVHIIDEREADDQERLERTGEEF